METIQILGNVGNGKCNRLILYIILSLCTNWQMCVAVCYMVGNQDAQHLRNLMKGKGGFHFINYLASISRIIALGKSTFAVMRLVLKDPSNRDTSILFVPASVQ